MDCRITELRYKEVIDIRDGTRYGYVGDVAVDIASGTVTALVVYGRPRLFGLLGREEDLVFPWQAVKRMGEDIILVETDRPTRRMLPKGWEERKIFF